MSRALEKAREQFQAGRYKQAVNLLYEVAAAADAPPDEVSGLLELAGAIRDRTDGDLRAQAETHVRRAQKRIDDQEHSDMAARVGQLQAELEQDPARLARWACEAGLRWLEVESPEDVVAASVRKAMTAATGGANAAPEACLIDLVEAEGWRLESVVHRFKPTRVQTSILRGADLLGGDAVEGDEKYLYLFRRAAEAARPASE